MPRNSQGIFDEVYAATGDKSFPTFPFTEGWDSAYSTVNSGKFPERTVFNFLYNELYALGVDSNTFGGSLPWDALITYEQDAVVTGTDGRLYIALIQTLNENPTLNPLIWSPFRSNEELGAEVNPTGASLVGTESDAYGSETLQIANDRNANRIPYASARISETGGVYSVARGDNIASVNKIGVGQIQINFTVDFPYNAFVCFASSQSSGTQARLISFDNFLVGSVDAFLYEADGNSSLIDTSFMFMAALTGGFTP